MRRSGHPRVGWRNSRRRIFMIMIMSAPRYKGDGARHGGAGDRAGQNTVELEVKPWQSMMKRHGEAGVIF